MKNKKVEIVYVIINRKIEITEACEVKRTDKIFSYKKIAVF